MNKEMCDEEFNKYFEEETNKQIFKIKMDEPMKLIINYDYYFLLLKKVERLESKIKTLEKYKDDYKRMKDNFDAKVDVIEDLHKDLEEYNNKLNEVVRGRNEALKKSYADDVKITKVIEIINNLKPLSEEETGIKEMLKLAYSEDNIKNLETSFKTICHLEDFEIAIWNIKDILKNGEKDD